MHDIMKQIYNLFAVIRYGTHIRGPGWSAGVGTLSEHQMTWPISYGITPHGAQ